MPCTRQYHVKLRRRKPGDRVFSIARATDLEEVDPPLVRKPELLGRLQGGGEHDCQQAALYHASDNVKWQALLSEAVLKTPPKLGDFLVAGGKGAVGKG